MSVVDTTLARLRDHMGFDVAYVAQLDADDMIIRAHCAPDFPAELPAQFTIPREDGFCHHMINGDIPQIVHDSAEHPAVVDAPTRHDFNIQSYIGVPLHRRDGSVYGSLCCIGHTPNQSLNDRDLRTIKLFAEIVVEQIDRELEDRQFLEERKSRIASTIEDKRFSAVYQPIVGLQSGALKGFEALCRFDTPTRTPDVWFAEAAQVGLGISLEVAAIAQTLPALAILPDTLALTVNISPEGLMSSDLNDLLATQPASRLILEVTEHAAVEDYRALDDCIQTYRDMDFKVAVDDAGAGYSSLRHIVQLQPDIIKLDMSLTRDIHKDQVRRSLANALVYFARQTNAEIVAEGIETQAEATTLSRLGVTWGQGYFFSKPLPLEAAVTFAKDRSDLPRIA